MNNKKELIIMSGPPCSGKSTFIKNNSPDKAVVSRDKIREDLFGKNYKQNPSGEQKVSIEEEALLQYYKNYDFIVDNCNCRVKYIDNLVKRFRDTHLIEIITLNQPLIKLYCRNILRYLKQGKWIPFKVIKTMRNNQKNINYEAFKDYIRK